jgi:glycerol-3-phosphate dehydrogenase
MVTTTNARNQGLTFLESQVWDVVIIGAGATGAGAALDAASRGLKTLLVDQADFASGTSGKSTKLIHGGLRYLKNFEIGLVREVGRERAILQRNARHIIHRDEMYLPVYKNGELGWYSTAAALWVYEWLAGVVRQERRVMLPVQEFLKVISISKSSELLGAAKYYEYRTDDARLTLSLVQSAQKYGATALNYVKCKTLVYNDQHQINGVELEDVDTNKVYNVKAKSVVNAAGPWSDEITRLDGEQKNKLKGSRGIHIVVDQVQFPLQKSVYFDAIDGRMVFAIPREGKVYIGTTDVFSNDNLYHPLIPASEKTYLLKCVQDKFNVPHLNESHIESAWSGVRPLVLEQGKSEGKISRKDELSISKSGLITIAGGKLTGYRVMAERTIDKVCSTLSIKVKSKTETIPLHGGDFSTDQVYEQFVQKESHRVQQAFDCSAAQALTIVQRYGTQINQFLACIHEVEMQAKQFNVNLLLATEVYFAVVHEMAQCPEDVYVRRLSRFYFDLPDLKNNIQALITYMAYLLNKDEAWQAHHLAEFNKHVFNALG